MSLPTTLPRDSLHLHAPQLIIPTVESDTCCLCDDKFQAGGEFPVILNCGHSFGATCIATWINQNTSNKCPLCRKSPYAPFRVQQTSAAVEVPAIPPNNGSDDRPDPASQPEEGGQTSSTQLSRSLTTIALWEFQIEGFTTRDPAKAVEVMATAWLLRSSPRENASGLAHSYVSTLQGAYDAIKQALENATKSAAANGLPINPYLIMQAELQQLRRRATTDDESGSRNKWVGLIQLAALQSSKLESSFSDRMTIAKLITSPSRTAPFQPTTELAARLPFVETIFSELIGILNESRATSLFSALTVDPDKVERAYLAGVDGSSQSWEPQTHDFFIHLLPQNAPRQLNSLFDASNSTFQASVQANQGSEDVPSISVVETRLSDNTPPSAANATQSGLFNPGNRTTSAEQQSTGLFSALSSSSAAHSGNSSPSVSNSNGGSSQLPTNSLFRNSNRSAQSGSGGLFGSLGQSSPLQPRGSDLFSSLGSTSASQDSSTNPFASSNTANQPSARGPFSSSNTATRNMGLSGPSLPPTSAFYSGPGLFNNTNTNSGSGSATKEVTRSRTSVFGGNIAVLCAGTNITPVPTYTENVRYGPIVVDHFQSICFRAPYSDWSFEELRLADYYQNKRYGDVIRQNSAFFSSASGGFEQQHGTSSAFGQPQSTTSAFRQPQSTTNAFGQPQGTTNAFGQPQSTSSAFGERSFGGDLSGSGSSSSQFNNIPSSSNNRGLFASGSTAFPPQPQTSGIFGSSGSSTQTQRPAASFLSSSSSATQPQNRDLFSNLNNSNLSNISAPSIGLFSSGNNASEISVINNPPIRAASNTSENRNSPSQHPSTNNSSQLPGASGLFRPQSQPAPARSPTSTNSNRERRTPTPKVRLPTTVPAVLSTDGSEESQTHLANTSSTAEATSSHPTETSQQTSITLANLPVLDTAAEGSLTQAQQHQRAESVSEAPLSRNLDPENLSTANEDQIESDSANLRSAGQNTAPASMEAAVITDATVDSSVTPASVSDTLPSSSEHSGSVNLLTNIPSTTGSQSQTSNETMQHPEIAQDGPASLERLKTVSGHSYSSERAEQEPRVDISSLVSPEMTTQPEATINVLPTVTAPGESSAFDQRHQELSHTHTSPLSRVLDLNSMPMLNLLETPAISHDEVRGDKWSTLLRRIERYRTRLDMPGGSSTYQQQEQENQVLKLIEGVLDLAEAGRAI